MQSTDTIRVTVNGDARAFQAGGHVRDLLDTLGLHPGMVVVEHNRVILERASLAAVPLHDGDVLEVVHFVGGG
ncbi:MAG: sulfur carrier protein ThiS [Longimicrobiales bacterium]